MRGDEALRTIPPSYVHALRLASMGASDEELATTLSVDQSSVPSMLALAAAKLVTALGAGEGPVPVEAALERHDVPDAEVAVATSALREVPYE